jgi:hypothetical protein
MPFTREEREAIFRRYTHFFVAQHAAEAARHLFSARLSTHLDTHELRLDGEPHSNLIGVTPEESALRTRIEAARQVWRDSIKHMSGTDWGEKRFEALRAQAEREYESGLHKLIVCPCPLCGRLLVRNFDPLGLDGFWWHKRSPAGPEPCPHYCVVRYAVYPEEPLPKREGVRIFLGPQLPHVIPRLLELPTMVAVLSETRADPKLRIYMTTYFAEKRPPESQLCSPWSSNIHSFVDAQGLVGWREENEEIDPVLAPWIQRGRLLWCQPGSDNKRLADPHDACPYLGLPGDSTIQSTEGPDIPVDGRISKLGAWYTLREPEWGGWDR